jgi:DNA-binding CsgD family transcriptional regulator
MVSMMDILPGAVPLMVDVRQSGSGPGRGVGAVAAGQSLRLIARQLGKRVPSVRAFVLQTGGVQHHSPRRAQRSLSMAEREEISRGVAAGEPCRQIAARLGRAPSTVSRELVRTVAGAAIGLRSLTPLPSGGPSGPSRPSW